MLITCLSDLHGHYPPLPGGDLLIIAGDLTAGNTVREYQVFKDWIKTQPYAHKIIIAGNHDGCLQKNLISWPKELTYLCDSGVVIDGLNIWGSPWTPAFGAWYFMQGRGAPIKHKWDLIPDGIDILITHGPPHEILDRVDSRHVGCEELLLACERIQPRLHVFGHIHEGYGRCDYGRTVHINASHVNERYEPINPPISIELI